MNTKKPLVTYRIMTFLAIVVGVIGVALLFLPGFELLSLMLALVILGGLIGGKNGYEQQDCARLQQSYRSAFEWLLLVILAVLLSPHFRNGLAWEKERWSF